MANPEHLTILGQGVEAWNRWRPECPEIWPDPFETDLHRVDLGSTDIYSSDVFPASGQFRYLEREIQEDM